MECFRLIALGCLALILAACQSGPPATLEERMGAYQWRAVAEADSLYIMPAAATDLVIGTWKKPWDNGIEQRSSLRSDSIIPGEGYLLLRFIARPLDVSELFSLGQSLSPRHFTDRNLPRRLQEEFPGLRTELVREPRSNRYGPYYYAVARYGDQRCVFAWQVLDSSSGTLPPHLRRLEKEYRLCGGDDVEVNRLLQPFEQGMVRPDTGVLPRAGFSAPVGQLPSRQATAAQPTASPATRSAGSFPLPAGAAAPMGSSDAATPSPRRLFNGHSGQGTTTTTSGSGGFPMPAGR